MQAAVRPTPGPHPRGRFDGIVRYPIRGWLHPYDMDRNDGEEDGGGGAGRRTFLKGATTTLLAAGALGTSVTSAAADGEGYQTTTKRIASWDDTELATRLYIPEGSGPFPAVLITHGYGADKEGGIPARMGPKYAKHGYVVLTYDSRGFGESDGEVGVDGPKEVNDAQHLLDWLGDATRADVGGRGSGPLVERDRSGDIRVGMDGLSYAGGIQLNLAAVDDRLDAILPRWAWNDLVYSLAPNGGIKLAWTTILQEFGLQGSRDVETGGDYDVDERDVRNGVDPRLYKFYTESLATNDFSPAARAFFKLRSPSTKGDGLAENAPPSLLITGWNDTLFTATETVRNHELLEAGGQDSRMVFIRGGHSLEQQGPLQQGEIDRMALTWMHRHVGGEAPELPSSWAAAAGESSRNANPNADRNATATADIPEVTYWRAQAGDFVTAPGIPDAEDGPSRTLAEAANASSGTTDLAGGPVGGSNSEVLVQRNDDYAEGTYADFDYPVDAATEVLGVPEVTLTVTPLGRDPLVFVKVYHVTADGEEELVYNQATPYEVAGAVGEAREISFDLAGIERQFAAGDTLRVTVATTDVAYADSRTSAGVRLDNDASTVRIPVRGESGLAEPSGSRAADSTDTDVTPLDSL